MIVELAVLTGGALSMGAYSLREPSLSAIWRKCFDKLLPQKSLPTSPPCSTATSQAIRAASMQTQQLQIEVLASSAALGLTITGAIASPWFGIAALPLLVYLRLPTLQRVLKRLIDERRVDDDLLETTVVVVSLGSGYWILAHTQVWMNQLLQWHLYRQETQARKQLWQKTPPQPQLTRIQRFTTSYADSPNGDSDLAIANEIEVALEQIAINEQIVVNAGEWLPVDGTVLSGWALLDERYLRRCPQPVEKSIGDTVFASSLVLSGQLVVRAERIGDASIAGQMIAALQQAAQPPIMQEKRLAQTQQAAGWMFGIGSLAALLADPILGASLLNAGVGHDGVKVTSLTSLRSLDAALSHGMLVRDRGVFERLSQVNIILFDWRVLEYPEALCTLPKIRQQTEAKRYLLVDATTVINEKLLEEIQIDGVVEVTTTQSAVQWVQQQQREDKTVCMVGNGVVDAVVMQQADVSISTCPFSFMSTDVGQVILLNQSFAQLPLLFQLAQQWRMQTQTSFSISLLSGGITVLCTIFLQTGLTLSILVRSLGGLATIETPGWLALSDSRINH